MLDASLALPHGATRTQPAASGFVTVTFNDTAPTPVAGTNPARSVTFTASDEPGVNFDFVTGTAPAGYSGRVSTKRRGATAVKLPGGYQPLRSTMTSVVA